MLHKAHLDRPGFLQDEPAILAISVAGVPTIAIPCTPGRIQLEAARDKDEALLALPLNSARTQRP